jgi:hypothetical protein
MTAWRDVEVAAAGALDGPSDEDLQAIRTAHFTVEAVKEREQVTDHDVAAFVDVLGASAGEAGRWIHSHGSRWSATPPTTSATPSTSWGAGTWPRTTIPITVAVAGSSETSRA